MLKSAINILVFSLPLHKHHEHTALQYFRWLTITPVFEHWTWLQIQVTWGGSRGHTITH